MLDDGVMAILLEKGLCCACVRTLRFEREVTFEIVSGKKPLWEFPIAVLEDGSSHPIAILCSDCAALRKAPIFAVEFGPGFFIRYYRVEILPDSEEEDARRRLHSGTLAE